MYKIIYKILIFVYNITYLIWSQSHKIAYLYKIAKFLCNCHVIWSQIHPIAYLYKIIKFLYNIAYLIWPQIL